MATRISRRRFLIAAAASAALLPLSCTRRGQALRVGLALGGGGAKGLAHIVMLEVFDELGIRPHRIAGTSIGAIIGALYAGGRSAREIRAMVRDFVGRDGDTLTDFFGSGKALRWLDFIDPALGRGGLLSSDDFMAFLHETLGIDRFDQLRFPFQVVAADLWSGEPVVLDDGPLYPALQASMAVPGVFAPVHLGGRLLVDGGVVNPLPFDLLMDDCDLVVAIDVAGNRNHEDGETPSFLSVLFHSFHNMEKAILREKLQHEKPDIYVRPDINDVRLLEFYKADQVFAEAQPARARLKRRLETVVRNGGGYAGCSLPR